MLTLRPAHIVRLLACAAIAGTMFLAAPTAARADGPTEQAAAIAAYKAAHDTDPHVPLSAKDQALLAKKDRQARAHYSTIAEAAAQSVTPAAAQYWGHTIGSAAQGQLNSYYCGPAAVSEALVIKPGISVSQSTAGYLLRTDTNGTAWSGVNARVTYPTGYPVRDVMNYKLGYTFYYPVGLPYSPSSNDVSLYIWRLTVDIDSYYPVIGDAWEVAGYDHLWGHPQNQTIFHWFTISGYGHYGNSSNYMDSAFTVWSQVQPFNWYFSSSTLVSILGGRGYVW